MSSAALDGRDYVLPDDIKTLAEPVLAHRIMLSSEAQVARRTTRQIIADLLTRIPVPTEAGAVPPPPPPVAVRSSNRPPARGTR